MHDGAVFHFIATQVLGVHQVWKPGAAAFLGLVMLSASPQMFLGILQTRLAGF